MKLIEFKDGSNYIVYVNPLLVTHVLEYRPGLTMIFFNNASSDKQIRIVVQGDVEEVALTLQK